MNSKLTYVLFLSLISFLVASCSPETPEDEKATKGSELTFSVAALSRGSVTKDITFQGSKFAVFGDKSFTGSNGGNPSVIFDNTQVEYKDQIWRYDDTQYWFPNHEHSFVAVYPLQLVNNVNTPVYKNSRLTFTYSLPLSSGSEIKREEITDILAATHRRLSDFSEGMPVTLRFSHLMSLINISPSFSDNVMDNSAYIQFQKLEIKGIKNKAAFSILPASRLSSNQTDDRVIEVTAHEGQAKLTIEFDEPKKIMNHGQNVSLFDADDAIIMLPQLFAADSQAELILTYTVNGDSQQRTISSPLRLREWESGKSYNYIMTLDRTGLISNSTSISDWDKLNAGNIDAH